LERAASASDSSASGSVAPSLPCRCHAPKEAASRRCRMGHGIHATTTGPLGAGLPARDASVTSKPSGSALSAELDSPASHLASDPLTRSGRGARREAQGSIAPGASDASASRRVATAVVWLCSVAESFVTGPIRRRNIAKMATLGWKGPTVSWPRRQRSITPLVRKELQ